MNDNQFTYISDHVAIRVRDLVDATAFYGTVFGAVALTDPFLVDGALAEGMIGGPPGTSFRMRQIGFNRGVMELIELNAPAGRPGRVRGDLLNVLHIGVQVDDVASAIARVEAAGGGVVVPAMSWGSATLCFCTDPDGTVLELADTAIHELLVHTRASRLVSPRV